MSYIVDHRPMSEGEIIVLAAQERRREEMRTAMLSMRRMTINLAVYVLRSHGHIVEERMAGD